MWGGGDSLFLFRLFTGFKLYSCESKGTPLMPPPENKALLRPNQGTMVVNNPLIRILFPGGIGITGVPLDSHDICPRFFWGVN